MAGRTVGRIALLSIHPRHADAIMAGHKRVELRRAPLASDVTHVVVYATAPIQAVVGWFEVAGVDTDTKTGIWEAYGQLTGLTRREYREYFAGAPQAVAIKVWRAHRLDPALPLTELPGVRRPPQSFQYVDRDATVRVLHPRIDSMASASA